MGTGTVFTYNRNQTVSLPLEAHFPEHVKTVSVRVVGQDRILSPTVKSWGSFFLPANTATDDYMPERASQEQLVRESF